MKKLFLILTALLLAMLMAAALADTAVDPGAGQPTVPMPANDSFDNPSILVPGTFYRGGRDIKYQMAFVPPVTGTYTVYGKTDGEYALSFEILDEYKHSIGWSFSNDSQRVPLERNVDLEAGKTYHFSGGSYYNHRWSNGDFTIALYPTDYSGATVGLPAMESFENPCKIKPDIVYRGVKDPKYQLVFTPEVSGTYVVYGETDDTSSLFFGIVDANKQGIGWEFDNDNKMGPIYRAVEMEAGKEYHFIGKSSNGRWSRTSFSFSLTYVDESETERVMSAMTSFNLPAHIRAGIRYQGAGNVKYKQAFVPEKDGAYTVTVTTDDTIRVSFTIVDEYQQGIGWSMNNDSAKGTRVKNIQLKGGHTYCFYSEYNNNKWSNGPFTFSIAPAEGETAGLLPAMEVFSNPGIIEAGVLYHGDAKQKYELVFTPAETGTYSVYAKTDEVKSLQVKLLNDYQEAIGWGLKHSEKQTPTVSTVELEAGKAYHFTGDWYSSTWSYSSFDFAICAPSRHAGSLSDFQTVQEPTCTEAGFSAQLCSLCQQPINRREIPAKGHTPGEPVIHSQPTCVENGVKTTQCAVCGVEISREEIPATGHTPGEPVVYQKATCLAPGLQITQCTVCGAEITREEIPAAAHQPGVWVDLKAVTCTEAGQRVQRCTVCNADLAKEEIPATGHTPGVWVDLKPATCTADGQRVQRCATCAETLKTETVPAFGHSPMDWQITREAECLHSGLKEKKCSICGLSLEREEIPALGHSYTEWVTTIEPTKDTEGERTRHCIHCGETQHEAIEKVNKFLGIF